MEQHAQLLPVPHALKVLDTVAAASGGRVVLFYSGGKDSLVLLDMARQKFKEVVCVFMYFVPGLVHCEIYLNYARRFPNVRVVQYEHFSLSEIRRHGIYCKATDEPKRTLKDVSEQACQDAGIAWSLYGMKKADSLNRRIWLDTLEDLAVERRTSKAYPLSLWTNKLVNNYRERTRLPHPISYGDKASNGVGFNYDCFLYLRRYYPQDLATIYRHFPASEQLLFEYDHAAQTLAPSDFAAWLKKKGVKQ
jgi:3'-phosphoadenosine 5'-phosphosulfate sulfotransferase (PAPS reductase)/FAD synthetase